MAREVIDDERRRLLDGTAAGCRRGAEHGMSETRVRRVAAVATPEPDAARVREVIVERPGRRGVGLDRPKRTAVAAGTAGDAGAACAAVDLRRQLNLLGASAHRLSSQCNRTFLLIMSASLLPAPKAQSSCAVELKQIPPPLSRGVGQPTDVKITFVDHDRQNIRVDVLGTNIIFQNIPLDRLIKMVFLTRGQRLFW